MEKLTVTTLFFIVLFYFYWFWGVVQVDLKIEYKNAFSQGERGKHFSPFFIYSLLLIYLISRYLTMFKVLITK